MKRLMSTALALVLIGGSAAQARPAGEEYARRDRDGEDVARTEPAERGPRPEHQDRRDRGPPGPRHDAPSESRAGPPDGRPPFVPDQVRRADEGDRRDYRRGERRDDRDRNDWSWNQDRRGEGRNDQDRDRDGDRRRFEEQRRQWRDRDRGRQQYDERRWSRSYHAPRRYRAPVYRPPVGWYARSWAFNDYLPRGWYGPSYYLDWRLYRLPFPPIGCEWVRVGDDALLVDVWTGRILTVYYGLFW